jgi:PAS domain S-box-containing protein
MAKKNKSLKAISILVIEDNPGDARLIEEYLKMDTSVNYSISFTSTLAESLNTLSNQKFDVVLVDLGLPDSQGIYTFQEIINASPRSPIVIITGTDNENIGIEAIRDGAQNYMVKNQINSTLLVRTIKFAIEIKRKNVELKESREKYCSIFEGAASLILSVNPSGEILECNNRIRLLLGYNKEEVIGQSINMIIHPDSYEKAKKSMSEVFENGVLCTGEYKMKRKDGAAIFVNIHSSALQDENNKNVIASCIVDDITQRILYEKNQLFTTKILSILNRRNEWHKLITDILTEIREFSGIEAVGIRNKEGEDYPYFNSVGFSDSFIKKENFLCARNLKGELVYDSDGKTILECMCGNIISKRTDSTLSFFTEAGSFWTNSTTDLLATTTDKERQTHTRNHCNVAGYESVALIPLISENEIMGLLQLNDKRKNMFTEEMVHFFEEIGLTIGIAFKRIKAEKRIKDNEEKFSKAFQTSPYAITITCAKDGRFIDVNDTFTPITGFTREESLANSSVGLQIWVNSEDRKSIVTALTEGKEVIGREFQFRKKNGNIITGLFSARFITLNNEQFILSSINDITQRKISEEALSNERYLMYTLMNNVPENIFFKDRESRFIRISKAQANTFGLNDPSEAEGKTDFNFFTEEHARQAYEDELEIIRTGQPISKEEKETWVNRPDTWVLTTKLPLHDKDRNIIGTFGISIDITERKQAEIILHEKSQKIEAQNEKLLGTNEELKQAKEKAEESDKLKTAFLHNISHEIRTPMNAIVGFSGFLNDPGLTADKRKHFTDIIVQSSNQLLSIITNIVDIATLEAGQERVQETNINLNVICKLIYEQYLSKAQSLSITLQYKTTLSEDEAGISTDKTKLIQVLSNIIGNSLKFTLQGYINFGYQLKNDYIEFFVEDTGIGIKEEMHEEIFKRFSQVDGSYTRDFGGSGLGLSISKAYIEMLGGKMWLISQLDKGSTFYFTIPYKKTMSDGLSFNKPAREIKIEYDKPKTLLIAEDEDFNYMLLEELLADINSKILRARNGIEAVEICKSNQHIDLVLMDIKMPLMSGYEATKQIREFLPNLPIIAQTAYTTDFDKKKALSCGCNDFISKPLEKKLLVSKINEQLHKT